MPNHRKLWAVLLLTLLLSACSMVRMTYDQAHTISYWWIDSYLDFSDDQEAKVASDLREIHQWHRTNQLPDYAELMAAIGSRTPSDATPAATCADVDAALARLDTFADHVAPYLARLARQLRPAQLAHLRKTFAAKDETWRDKWIKPARDELAARRYEEWLDRADLFYGDISEEQKAFMKSAVARSVLDVNISWVQRQQRQDDILVTLGRIVESRASQSVAEAEMKALLDRALHPQEPAYRAMVQNVLTETCANLAGLHQLTTPKQRLRAQEKLAAYEQDFRVLSRN